MTDHFSAEGRNAIITGLKSYLADTTVVYFKTHTYHWNVEGQNFYSLHLMFEKFYQELWESMDEIAERIRAFGGKPPQSLHELLKVASIEEFETAPTSQIMLKNLRENYLTLAEKAHNVGSIAEEHGDRVTTDMMTEQSAFLEKSAWMVQSSIIG
ncbi:MAG: DNA starvation/stationary phase protection protein [Proteobacteria bacterium]|nr:DNA starvation/stationary phase protection protein [Pseudomonadota bacterium]